MKKKILSIIIILSLIITNMCTVFAQKTSQDYANEKKRVEADQKKADGQLKEVEGKLDDALQQVSEVSESINSVETDISNLTNQVKELDDSIVKKQKDLEEKQVLLDERLSAAYMNKGNTYLEALFSGGIVNFVSNYDMIKQIAEYDNNLIKSVKDTKQSLEQEKEKVEKVKSEKEEKKNELKKLQQEKQKKVDSLTAEQKDIQKKLEDYNAEMKKLEKLEKEQIEKEKKTKKEAEEKARIENTKNNNTTNNNGGSNSGGSSNPTQSTGAFMWPVPSSHRISSNYGYRIHPIYHTKKLHAGIDIAAAGGADIVAADSGTVILSSFGYNGGYGNYVIISHGNGVTTRYAHCSNLYVKVGQTVTKGQTIAAVGTTGSSTGNHCHFEVRINGESKNPLNYV